MSYNNPCLVFAPILLEKVDIALHRGRVPHGHVVLSVGLLKVAAIAAVIINLLEDSTVAVGRVRDGLADGLWAHGVGRVAVALQQLLLGLEGHAALLDLGGVDLECERNGL